MSRHEIGIISLLNWSRIPLSEGIPGRQDSAMARKHRYLPPGMPVHVVQRGNNRQACFSSVADLKAFAKWLGEGAEQFEVKVHAWVLMTNHVHLLVTPEREHSVSRMMQQIGRHYVQYFNRRYSRTGTLFEGRFRSHLVQSSIYFLRCARYIELNPVRAGVVAAPGQYSWSSYGAHAFGVPVNFWSAHDEYLSLDGTPEGRQKAYRALFSEELGQDVQSVISSSLKQGIAYGDDAYKGRIERVSGIPQHPLKRGRKPL